MMKRSQVLGYDIRNLIDREEEKLNQTRYTQPAILTTSVTIYRLLQEEGIQAAIVAGLSLWRIPYGSRWCFWSLQRRLIWRQSVVFLWRRQLLLALVKWLRF